jgi:Flp pilus assembly protein TadG
MKIFKQVMGAWLRFRGDEGGNQLVEISIALPILLSLLVVTAETGRLFYTNTTLAKGTRLAARYLTTVPLNTDARRTLYYANARNLVVYGTATPATGATPILPGLTTSKVVITQLGGIPTISPQTVSVQITGVTFQPVIDLGKVTHVPSLSLAVALTPSTTMRYLVTQPLN